MRAFSSGKIQGSSSHISRAIAGLAALAGVLVMAVACSADPAGEAGPPNPDGKAEGSVCANDSECQSLGCQNGKCTAPPNGSATSDKKDGDGCTKGADCESGACVGGVCKAPAPDDKIKNGDETDVDCGGTKAPKCAVGKACVKHEDCASDACNYEKKCVEAPSCTGHFGGDTCGEGDTGTDGAKHESCCTTVSATAGDLRVGKYQVTAGRMRAFVERFNGNLRSWADAGPKGWDSSWNDQLPTSMDEALGALGPLTKRGCSVPNQGGRTFWQDIAGDEKSDFSKDVLDEKALNCVSWYMAQALCHFDGGRLIAGDEARALMTNNGTTTYPWGTSPRVSAKVQIEQIVHDYSYQTPNPPAGMRTVGDNPLDHAFFMAPPGRRPAGANKIGAQDAMGDMMPWVNDGPNRFAWTSSWEEHTVMQPFVGTWPPASSPDPDSERDGYYALGARCVFE